MLEALIVLVVLGFVGIVLLGVVLALLGAVFGIVAGLLELAVKAALLLGAGWLVVKLVRGAERPGRSLTRTEQDWLDTRG